MISIKKIFTIIIAFFVFGKSVFAITNAPIDITTMSMTEISEALDDGVITSETLVTLYLERIEEYNSKYNAILYLNKNAVEEAKALDIKRNNNEILGVLHGIPIVVKTNIDVKGIATTAGSSMLSDNMPKEDAEVIKKLKSAGAIILGTTNMSRFAFSAGNSNSSFGKVRNAYNTNYSPYGSSGGSAVAVAASFASAALGTDTNSSVRVPASGNNLVGIRPTVGFLSSKGVIPYDITRDTVGILTKTVKDNATLLNVLSDNDGTNYLESTNSSFKNKTIGVVNTFLKGYSGASLKANSLTYQPVYEMMLSAIKKMESEGATIVYLDDFFTTYYYSLYSVSQGGFTFCKGFNDYIKGTTGSVRNFNILADAYELFGYMNSCNYSESNITDLTKARDKYRKHVLNVFDTNDLDAIVYPTVKNETLLMSELDKGVKAPSTFVSSVTGYPSITIPLGFHNNMPYGIEFLTLEREEEKLYELASSLEILNDNWQAPSISPSLYNISDSVTELVKIYQDENYWSEEKVSNKYIDKIRLLKKEIAEYYIMYSSNENREEDAKIILTKINSDDLDRKEAENVYDLYNNKLIIVGYIGLLICFLLVFRNKKIKK